MKETAINLLNIFRIIFSYFFIILCLHSSATMYYHYYHYYSIYCIVVGRCLLLFYYFFFSLLSFFASSTPRAATLSWDSQATHRRLAATTRFLKIKGTRAHPGYIPSNSCAQQWYCGRNFNGQVQFERWARRVNGRRLAELQGQPTQENTRRTKIMIKSSQRTCIT